MIFIPIWHAFKQCLFEGVLVWVLGKSSCPHQELAIKAHYAFATGELDFTIMFHGLLSGCCGYECLVELNDHGFKGPNASDVIWAFNFVTEPMLSFSCEASSCN